MAEHDLAKVEAAGSVPAVRSNFAQEANLVKAPR
jgi:hypothetical protein